MSTTAIIGKLINERRDELDILQDELVAKMQAAGHKRIIRERLSEWANGRGPEIRASEIVDFCRILRCPPWWLLGMTRAEAERLEIGFHSD